MRELLKEAAEILGDCYYNGKEPLSDGTRAMVAKVIKRITAALAEPEPKAMEIVDKLEKLLNMDQAVFPPPSSYFEAAALIADYGRRVPQWISVKERLPEALERVLVFYVNDLGKNRIDIGQHIPPKTVLAEDFLDEDAEGCSEYDEEHDCFWVDEGWWEDSWQAEVNYKIRDVVTHWMPLPEPPVGKEGEE